jgi:hypothetical protein
VTEPSSLDEFGPSFAEPLAGRAGVVSGDSPLALAPAGIRVSLGAVRVPGLQSSESVRARPGYRRAGPASPLWRQLEVRRGGSSRNAPPQAAAARATAASTPAGSLRV